jgi:NADH-quinone oxidoreductase subunit H
MTEFVVMALPVAIFALLFLMPLLMAGPLTWAERRQAAMIQDRVGPNRASIQLFGREYRAFGLLHPLADVIKLITKEDSIHKKVDRPLYNLAPFIALFPALVTFAIIPIGPDFKLWGSDFQLQIARLDSGILYVFAMSSLAVFGVTLAGYASRNKFALLGGLRASAQMISYEVTLGLSLLGIIMVYGSLEPYAIVVAQGDLLWGWLPKWGVFVQPVGLLIFFVASIAENKRTPFDLAEGESEIIGYFIEYSGMKFGMFFMAEYIEIVLISALVTTLFFGGYQVPYLGQEGFLLPGMDSVWALPHLLVVGMQVAAFMFKLLFFCWFQLMTRWSLPRFRYDQVMKLGWKILLPLSLANVVITAIVVLAGS